MAIATPPNQTYTPVIETIVLDQFTKIIPPFPLVGTAYTPSTSEPSDFGLTFATARIVTVNGALAAAMNTIQSGVAILVDVIAPPVGDEATEHLYPRSYECQLPSVAFPAPYASYPITMGNGSVATNFLVPKERVCQVVLQNH